MEVDLIKQTFNKKDLKDLGSGNYALPVKKEDIDVKDNYRGMLFGKYKGREGRFVEIDGTWYMPIPKDSISDLEKAEINRTGLQQMGDIAKENLGIKKAEDKIPGGKAAGKTMKDIMEKYNLSEGEAIKICEEGTKHELEHTTDKDIAREIARDHIWEMKDYYKKLKKIEKAVEDGILPEWVLEKAKYIRREGTKGNYKYIYKDTDNKKGKNGDEELKYIKDFNEYSKIAEKNLDNWIEENYGDYGIFHKEVQSGDKIKIPAKAIIPRSSVEFENSKTGESRSNTPIELEYVGSVLKIHDGHNRLKDIINKDQNQLIEVIIKSINPLGIIEQAYLDGKISKDILEKARTGTYADNAQNRKLKIVGQKYGSSKGQDDTGSKQNKQEETNNGKPSKQGDEAGNGDKTLEEHAKETSGSALETAAKEATDPDVREAAHKELDRREKEEKPQEEESKQSQEKENQEKVPKSDKSDNQKDSSKNTEEIKNDKKEESTKTSDKNQEVSEKTLEEYKNMSLDENTELYKKYSKDAMQAMTDNNMDKFHKLSDEISKLSKVRGEIIQKDKYEKGEQKEAEAKELGVTDDEIEAVQGYTGNDYKTINKELRKGEVSEENQKKVDTINSALDKLPKKRGKVYRGMSLPSNINEMLKEYEKGATVNMKAFTSTSESNKVAASFGAFRMEIDSKTGRDISGLSEFGEGEKEILFKTGAKFKVKTINIEKYKDPFLGDQILSVYVKLIEI